MSQEPLLESQYRLPNSYNAVPARSHFEPHLNNSPLISNAIIGFSDGLTVPFALTASLSSLGSSRLVIIAGMAELFSGAISMGVGGYLAGRNELENYLREQAKEYEEVETIPSREIDECIEILEEYGPSRDICHAFVTELKRDKEKWVQFMMRFELGLGDCPSPSDAWKSATVIGGAYFIGGLIPLLPYFWIPPFTALWVSVAITATILFVFGFAKMYVGRRDLYGAVKAGAQTLFVGGIAAAASYGIVKAIEGGKGIQ